jgi:hypothetical protein
LHNIGITFVLDHGIEHTLYLIERRETAYVGVGEAGGATQIAGFGDFDKGEARMLLVVGTEAAIQRAALFNGHLEVAWKGTRLIVLALAEIIGGIR